MTQHIQVVARDMVVPYLANVWRDDQTVMWHLADHLEWPKDEPTPIRFLPGGGKFQDWPGSVPSPIGAPPPPDQPDRRYYTALAGKVMDPPNTALYHYEIWVVDSNTHEKVHVQVFVRNDDGTEGWFDPDVGNQPQP